MIFILPLYFVSIQRMDLEDFHDRGREAEEQV